MVVARMAGGVKEPQGPIGQHQGHALCGRGDPLRRHADHRAVGARYRFGTVNGLSPLNQLAGVDQMRRASRVHHQLGAGEVPHQLAHTACMIQVDMGGNDPVDSLDRQTSCGQCGQQSWHAVVGACVNEGGTPCLCDQIARIELGPLKPGVDHINAMRQVLNPGEDGCHEAVPVRLNHWGHCGRVG